MSGTLPYRSPRETGGTTRNIVTFCHRRTIGKVSSASHKHDVRNMLLFVHIMEGKQLQRHASHIDKVVRANHCGVSAFSHSSIRTREFLEEHTLINNFI